MASPKQTSTENLFRQWRKNDAAAGQEMAQRFTDWYFAIAALRLGEHDGEAAFRAACTAFSHGVGKVTDARRLLGWAHGVARKQIHAVAPGGRVDDGDQPNAFTRSQSPKTLLDEARRELPGEMHLLEHAYRGDPVDDPQAVLRARYELKSWLKRQHQLPFRVTPGRPDPDRAPLTYYEAGRLADEVEDTHFELYMLHDMEVCQDVAEFAHFAIALRGGLPGAIPAKQPTRAERAAQPRTPSAVPSSSPSAHSNEARVHPATPSRPVETGDASGGGMNLTTIAVLVIVAAAVLGGIALVFLGG